MVTSPQLDERFVYDLTRHQGRLRGLLRCLLADSEHVEDVLQETNLLLVRKAADFQPGTDFWAWASRVARFQVLTLCKRLRRERLVFDDDLLELLADEAQEEAGQMEERREALVHCLQKLPAPQRQLLDMRYGLQQSINGISQSLFRPAGSIRQTLYRIREALLKCIEQRLSTEGTA